MEHLHLVAWQFRLNELERSRAAHQHHIRKEHVAAALGDGTSRATAKGWARRVLASLTRQVPKPTPLAVRS